MDLPGFTFTTVTLSKDLSELVDLPPNWWLLVAALPDCPTAIVKYLALPH